MNAGRNQAHFVVFVQIDERLPVARPIPAPAEHFQAEYAEFLKHFRHTVDSDSDILGTRNHARRGNQLRENFFCLTFPLTLLLDSVAFEKAQEQFFFMVVESCPRACLPEFVIRNEKTVIDFDERPVLPPFAQKVSDFLL